MAGYVGAVQDAAAAQGQFFLHGSANLGPISAGARPLLMRGMWIVALSF
jgi:hypothetical protein